MPYLFSHEDKTERERLAAIEAGLDPHTIECLERIGVGDGWRCLEVGAGTGSIAAWLCRRVGTMGKVVASFMRASFPHRERFERAYGKFIEALSSAGFQPKLGVRLGDELRAVGLQHVALKGILIEGTGGSDHPGSKVYRMTIERLRERMVKAGLLTNEEVDQLLADLQSPELHAITSIHCAAWGRRPC